MNPIELNNKMADEFKKNYDFSALKYDAEAIEEYKKEVESKMVKFNSRIDRFVFLINEGYYEDFLAVYTSDFLLELEEYARSFKHEFKSYMAISKFYLDYAMKTNDKKQYFEHYEDRVVAVALHLAQGDTELAKRFVKAIIQGYQPATPTFLNAGKGQRGEMVSCFLLEMDDSLNSIQHVEAMAGQLSKIGGGVAINLSRLRARGEAIKGIEDAASGVVPVMKLLEDRFAYVNQLGQRKGAGATYLNIFHWDLVEFLDTKKINADEKSRIQSLSIGLIVPSKFFEIAEKGEDFYVFKPLTVFAEYGIALDDMQMDEWYDELVANPNVGKRALDAREILGKLAFINLSSGYPYLMFRDNANKVHALKEIGTIKMSNLCTEIFQLQETSFIDDYGYEDEIKRDISCNLGSLNITKVMESRNMEEIVFSAMDALTAVSDMSDIENAPSVKKANAELHSVGLGAMDLHGFLAKNKIRYESEEALDFANVFFAYLNFLTIKKSAMIAKERQTTFKDFEKSEYANGNYFTKYVTGSFLPRTEKVREVFRGIALPTQGDWVELANYVHKYGMYHAYRMAIAPNGSISYVQDATASVMPVPAQIEARTYANATTYYPMPHLNAETFFYYQTAYDTSMFKLLKLVSVIQEHVDQGISTILYVKSDISTKEIGRYIVYAHKLGLKSIYYTRTEKQSLEDCVSCVV
ncbi:ribonucleoside-diphosphate reductase alpha subunit [Bacillus phage YungSlug]|nr:ribonucleoside-diphosphate reductase alpha subunit [Bacillus phage YungSlug]